MAGTTTKSRLTGLAESDVRDLVVNFNKSLTDDETMRAVLAQGNTLVEELHDDHATFKTAVDQTETLIEELHDDHATFKTAVDQTETLVEELHDDHATLKTAFDALRLFMQNHITTGDPGVSGGTAAAKVRTNAAIEFTVNGVGFTKASTDDFWTLDGANLPNAGSNVTGYLLLIDNAGAASVQRTPDAASVAALVWPVPTADRVVVGSVTITNGSAGDFVPGTTALNAAGITSVFNDGLTLAGVRDKVLPAGPATLTAVKPASAPATLTAAKPASGPATLTAAKPTSANVNAANDLTAAKIGDAISGSAVT